jgi:uncharacterized protein (UPF0276 family)
LKYTDLNYLDIYGKLQESFTFQLKQLVQEIDKQLAEDTNDQNIKREVFRILDHMLWRRKDKKELDEFASDGYEWLVEIIEEYQNKAKEIKDSSSGSGSYLKI